MVYLVYGNQMPTIKARSKKMASEFLGAPFDDFNFVKFDGFTTLVQDVVDECSSVALGYDKKVVCLENAYFLIKPKPKNSLESEQNYKKLVSYINNSNPDTLLIISCCSDDVDEKDEIYPIIQEKGKIFQIAAPSEKDWPNFCKLYFEKKGLKIDRDALMEVASRTSGDVALLLNTIAKLSLYKDHIRYDDVCLMVTRPLEDNVFQLFNLLLEKRNGDAVGLFKDLKENNVEPVSIISILSGQFRLLNQVSYLCKKGMDKEDIAKELNIKSGRVFFLSKLIYVISEDKIHQTLEELYKLDLNIKNGLVDRFYAFEIFLLNF